MSAPEYTFHRQCMYTPFGIIFVLIDFLLHTGSYIIMWFKLQVDGITVVLPIDLINGISIASNEGSVVFKTNFGLQVEFDGEDKLGVQVPNNYW